MTNRNAFDEHIKRQLENLSPEVPSGSWDKILQAQSGERRRGFFYFLKGNRWLILSVLLILFTVGALVFWNPKQPESTASLMPAIQDDGTETRTVNTPGSHSANLANSKSREHNLNNISATAGKQSTNLQESPGKVVSTLERPTRKPVTTPSISKTVPDGNEAEALADQTEGSPDENATSADFRKTAKTKTAKGNAVLNMAKAEIQEEIVSTDEDHGSHTELEGSLRQIYLQLQNDAEIANEPTTVRGITLQPLAIPCPGSGKPALGSRNYVEVYGSPDYVFRSFSDTASSAYLKQRKETTRFTSAFSFGIRYTRLFKSGFSFRTGVNFSQINERFKYESGQMLQNVYIVNEQGDTTGNYTATTSRYKVTQNRYRTLDVPLLIGYETRGERFRVNINAGPVINIYSWQKGDILGRDNQPVNITTGKSNSIYSFKTNAGIGLTGGASLYYKWKGNLYFLAEPWFRYNFSAANKADITLKQKFTTAGLRFGVRMDF